MNESFYGTECSADGPNNGRLISHEKGGGGGGGWGGGGGGGGGASAQKTTFINYSRKTLNCHKLPTEQRIKNFVCY